VRQGQDSFNKTVRSAEEVEQLLSVWQIGVRLPLRRLLVPRIEVPFVLQHASPHQAPELNRCEALGAHLVSHLAYSPPCRAPSPPDSRPGSWGISMPSSTAVSLAASPNPDRPNCSTKVVYEDVEVRGKIQRRATTPQTCHNASRRYPRSFSCSP
jgi:hypothetical protein